MHTLAFDGRMGASGDMILAALIDAGADPAVLAPVEDALGVEYVVDRTTTGTIAATTVEVRYASQTGNDAAQEGGETSPVRQSETGNSAGHSHDDGHSHDHAAGHTHAHDHSHGHAHDHDDQENVGDDHSASDHAVEGHGPNRSYTDVLDVVEGMALPDDVTDLALAIFERLGEAEAAVHGSDLDATHFHEVGADDAIADVVGVALLLADLDVDRIVTTPLSVGGGEVVMAHGRMQIPAPAVVEIAAEADYEIQGGPVDRELLTPTGAAILAEIAEGVETLPSMAVTATGYGAGDHDTGDRANALRVLVGESEGNLRREAITVLETNVDDVSPEMLGALQETLVEAGARDVSILPATMKKARPGHLLKVIVKPEDADRVARRLAEETGTLGVREHGAGHRWVADRETRSVTIDVDDESFDIDVKVASDRSGEWLDASAEFEDALAIAKETGRPVREIMDRAERALEE